MMWFFLWPLFLIPFALFYAFRPNVGAGCGPHGYVSTPAQPIGSDAVEIARTRLARGEITVEEYETIRGVLG